MDPLITAVVLNYNAPPEMLSRCLASLRAQTYGAFETVVVDNGSGEGSLDAAERTYPEVRVLRLGKNFGFAGGMNRGIAAAKGELILLLNFDVELDPGCAAELAKVIAQDEHLAGVAPKTVFVHDRHVIDNVGALINPSGAAYNMGIGQLDIGQYDVSEPVFGACFAAALFRKTAFSPSAVGPLDESFFMYYEDVDWCFRANMLGWRFRTAPRAVVAHVHSASVRHLDYSFKYYLIERNLLRTVLKNFESRRAMRVVARRTLTHLAKALLRRPYWTTGLQVVSRFWGELPRYWKVRNELQRRRVVPDREIFQHSFGEVPFFDPVRYTPFYRLDTLEAMYRRRFVVTGDRRTGEIAAYLRTLRDSKLRFDQEFRSRLVGELLRDEPSFVLDFLARIEL
jgi:GT2 family glycosyltransferase